jgi:hypothetical protein
MKKDSEIKVMYSNPFQEKRQILADLVQLSIWEIQACQCAGTYDKAIYYCNTLLQLLQQERALMEEQNQLICPEEDNNSGLAQKQ